MPISSRDTVLEGFKTCLTNITKANGFQNDVKQVERKFIYFDNVLSFPVLMVLGGDEKFTDDLGDTTHSDLSVRIAGYARNESAPEEAQCSILADVLKCLDSDTYNPYKAKMLPLGIDTDEGMLHDSGQGLSMFVLNLEVKYKFTRSNP